MAQKKLDTNGCQSRSPQVRRRGALRRARSVMPLVTLGVISAAASSSTGCGSSHDQSTFGDGGANHLGGNVTDSGGNFGGYTTLPDGAVVMTGNADGAGGGIPIVCDAGTGAACADQNCGGGGSTVITGRVLDPAGVNPLWGVTVFIRDPSIGLPDLDASGLQCGCGDIYPSDVLGYARTDENGVFSITSAPYGSGISIVVQIGKWRKEYDGFNITRCATNQVPDLALPKDSNEGNLPNIAISTGGADSLECLPYRMGVSASEYVAGDAAGGHIHIFHGYNGANTAAPAPDSYQALWDSTADLEKHDVVLLSCEGHETTGGGSSNMGGGGSGMTNAYQQSLMDYANAGGRVFASHYHYAWFRKPQGAQTSVAFAAANIASWQGSNNAAEDIDDSKAFDTQIDTTLASGAAFAEGTSMATWLGNVKALTNGLLPVQYARINVTALMQPPSVEWIHLASSVVSSDVKAQATTFVPNATQYFSVDTPIGASGESVCGRVVYSDLHVSGGPGAGVGNFPGDYGHQGGQGMQAGGTVPSGCAQHALSPQELALEFMLFDLSSCLQPTMGQPPPPPPVVIPK